MNTLAILDKKLFQDTLLSFTILYLKTNYNYILFVLLIIIKKVYLQDQFSHFIMLNHFKNIISIKLFSIN